MREKLRPFSAPPGSTSHVIFMHFLHLGHSGEGLRAGKSWAVGSGGGDQATHPPSYKTGLEQNCLSPQVTVLEVTLQRHFPRPSGLPKVARLR